MTHLMFTYSPIHLMLHLSYSTCTGSSKVWNLMDISRRIMLDIIARWGYDTDFRVSAKLTYIAKQHPISCDYSRL